MERHVALVAQQLHVGILLPAAHAAGTEAAFGVRVGFAVLTLRAGLPWNRSGLFTGQRFWDLTASFTRTFKRSVCSRQGAGARLLHLVDFIQKLDLTVPDDITGTPGGSRAGRGREESENE